MELSIDPDCLIVRREEKEKKRIEYTPVAPTQSYARERKESK